MRFSNQPKMKADDIEARIMRGLAGVNGISTAELQLRIMDEQDVHIPFATLWPAVDALVAKGQITKVGTEQGRVGPRSFYARTLRLVV